MSIPRIALCAQARSGSSMMMEALEAGGLFVDKSDEPDALILELFRNPRGLFENSKETSKGIFNNTVKVLQLNQIANIPADYKLIFLNRSFNEILASWQQVIATGTVQGRDMTKVDYIGVARERNTLWETVRAATTNKLELEYNAVVADPLTAMTAISAYVNTPDFTFNVDEAVKVIDANLYIKRS
jgi:hypothetical protein